MIVYIAGKMTGLPDKGRAKFAAAAKTLRDKGHIVLNPADLPVGMPSGSYMPICLAMVGVADAVYALENWLDSNGARVEVQYARYQGKAVIYENATEDRKLVETLILCNVIFPTTDKEYCYLADTDEYEVGEFVVVPVGKGNHEAIGMIKSISYGQEKEAPFPISEIKHILRKYDETEEKP